ncbi:MAG: hypothetical protein H7222_03480, partial [Methylotenera sp.]|nr:hypothetical protein [Oligoflexia bacterium]
MHKYETSKNDSFRISSAKIAVGVVGARGYSGLDLARILLAHPDAELKACFAQTSSTAPGSSGKNSFALSDYLPEASAASVPTLEMSEISQAVKTLGLKTLFLATPADVSLELAPRLLALGVDVIDLSGAFRLEAGQYPEWYALHHTSPELLKEAHYGLVPWAGPAAKTSLGGHLIANPGCYATSVLMAILPLLKEKIIQPASIVIDSKSGTSGAGKKTSEA